MLLKKNRFLILKARLCQKTRSGFPSGPCLGVKEERLVFLAVRRCYRSKGCTKATGLSAWLHPAVSTIKPTSPASAFAQATVDRSPSSPGEKTLALPSTSSGQASRRRSFLPKPRMMASRLSIRLPGLPQRLRVAEGVPVVAARDVTASACPHAPLPAIASSSLFLSLAHCI